MRLFVDDNLVPVSPDWGSVYDILHENIKDIMPQGKVIKDIDINEKNYGELMLDSEKSRAFKLSEIDDIKISTMSPENLVVESIASAVDFLNEFQRGIDSTTDEIRLGNYVEGFNNFAGYLSGLSVFVQVMEKIAQFANMDYTKYIYKEKSVQAYFGDTEKILASIMSTQKENDYVLLTDIVEFELKPNIAVWIDILTDIKAKVKI